MAERKTKTENAAAFKGLGTVQNQPIEREMQTSYLDYAMSVIVMRALPDVRDGLKPVHRRILYSMHEMGLRPTAKYQKSAKIVGHAMGNYHPHGDSAIYDTLVRMAQDFAMRVPLVQGQGNFGSMDGDSAAAMRYTEARLAGIAEELLRDIDKETVPFGPNYDGSHEEPRVLPAIFPNLLLNGSVGIAVGMATDIPPHNLGELCDGTIYLLEHPDCDIGELSAIIKGPDFPTGGIIYSTHDIKAAQATGKGPIVMRAKTDIVERGDAYDILVTEVPYQVNKATLLETIANFVKEKKIEGIRDLRDESNKDGVRVVIELKKDAYPKKVLNQLFQYTQLQGTFHVNMLALVDGIQPRVLTLKMMLEEYVKHRKDVITRRTQFDLAKTKERAHILEGLVMALEDIDAIIATIKKSKDRDDAKVNLMKKFRLSERQAIAILEMRLQQLANLERLKVEEELKEKKKLIKELEEILKNPKRILGIIIAELKAVKEKYATPRRTDIVSHPVGEFSEEDLIPNEASLVLLTRDGYLKRLPPETFRTQTRGGKGVIGLTTKEEDTVDHLLATTTHTNLLFFTSRGRVFQLRAHEVPEASRAAKGQAIVNFLQLAPGEKVTTILSAADLKQVKYLVMVTTHGVIKKVAIDAFATVRRSGLIALKLKDGDELTWVKPSKGSDEVVIVTKRGQAIRFKEADVRPMGRTAAGVRGIRLKGNDTVVGMDMVQEKGSRNAQLLSVMDHGFGKRTALTQYKVQRRGGSGIKTANITEKTGALVSTFVLDLDALPEGVHGDLIVVSAKGQVIRLAAKSISVVGRATQGVRVMRFKETGDRVASVTLV
ncbi:DNA gyrase subunit A [Candidatus Uhrbacteria bacterium]|nr:DNA gyrase subunit A [Candidatus Uhrbacteria bacterium]